MDSPGPHLRAIGAGLGVRAGFLAPGRQSSPQKPLQAWREESGPQHSQLHGSHPRHHGQAVPQLLELQSQLCDRACTPCVPAYSIDALIRVKGAIQLRGRLQLPVKFRDTAPFVHVFSQSIRGFTAQRTSRTMQHKRGGGYAKRESGLEGTAPWRDVETRDRDKSTEGDSAYQRRRSPGI